MGMTGGEGALLAAMLGSSAIGGLTAPSGQELSSFEGVEGLDPRQMMGETKGMMGDLMQALTGLAGQDATINTTVNPLPSFTGSGLPMPISAGGMDPNRLNPDLRSKPGVTIPRRTLSQYTGGANPRNAPPLGAQRDNQPPPGYQGPTHEGEDGMWYRGQWIPSKPKQGAQQQQGDPIAAAQLALNNL